MAGKSIYVSGMGHKSPIPAAKVINGLLYSSLINGASSETNEIPDDLAEQCSNMFRQISAVMEAAGGNVGDILKITFWLNDRKHRSAFAEEWERMFSDPQSRPARVTLNRELGGNKLVECELIAVLPVTDAG